MALDRKAAPHREAARPGPMASPKPALVALAVVLVAWATVELVLTAHLTFYQDTWAFLMHRQDNSLAAFLEPHNEHIVLIPVAIEKLLLALFGMTSAFPEYAVLIAINATSATLLFYWARGRVGPWLAVIGCALLLFLGPAWPVLLWPFEVGFAGATACGLAVLLLLDRRDPGSDRWACLLLVACLGFSSLGISFWLAAAVELLLRRREARPMRLYVVLIPIVLFVGWYAGWGHNAETHLSLHNALRAPVYVVTGIASSLEALAGLRTIPVNGGGSVYRGLALLVIALGAGFVFRVFFRRGLARRILPLAALLLSFWVLASLNYVPGREASSDRYVFSGVLFLLLIVAELVAPVMPSRRVLLATGALAALAIASNVATLNEAANFLHDETVITRADTGAIDIASRTVPADFSLTAEVAGTPSLIDVNAPEYLEAVSKWGSPGYSPGQLASTAPADARRQADIVLSHALPLRLQIFGGAGPSPKLPAGWRCSPSPRLSNADGIEVRSPRVRYAVAPGQPVVFDLRRFARGEFPISTSAVPGGAAGMIVLPRDRARTPWHLRAESSEPVRLCSPR